jgi:hypothetical protein
MSKRENENTDSKDEDCAEKKYKTEIPEHPFTKDAFTDVALVVEGHRLYLSKGFLVMVSPVFRRMFESEFKEKSATEIPLPGKTFDDVLVFLKTISPNIQLPITSKSVLIYGHVIITDVHFVILRTQLLQTNDT